MDESKKKQKTIIITTATNRRNEILFQQQRSGSMIDLHCHILPGIDDGAASIEDSLRMAQVAMSEGITTIVATPHHQNGTYINERNDIIQYVQQLNDRLIEEKYDLRIVLGQEIRLYGELLEDYQNDKLVTINDSSKYVLVELPSSHVPRYTKQVLFDMQLQGLLPIIVHPERNAEFMKNPDKLFELVEKGALTQVTASSVTGHFGKKIQKFSHQLIEASLTHFIASDAHNTTGRTFRLREAYELVAEKYGNDIVFYFQENAECVLSGSSVYREQPQQIKKKKLFGIF
jgi:protein-tyrosine phosphatase